MSNTMPGRTHQKGMKALNDPEGEVTLLLVGNDRAVRLVHATTPLEAIVLLQRLEEVGSRELRRAAIAVDGKIVHERVRRADGFRSVEDDRPS